MKYLLYQKNPFKNKFNGHSLKIINLSYQKIANRVIIQVFSNLQSQNHRLNIEYLAKISFAFVVAGKLKYPGNRTKKNKHEIEIET